MTPVTGPLFPQCGQRKTSQKRSQHASRAHFPHRIDGVLGNSEELPVSTGLGVRQKRGVGFLLGSLEPELDGSSCCLRCRDVRVLSIVGQVGRAPELADGGIREP